MSKIRIEKFSAAIDLSNHLYGEEDPDHFQNALRAYINALATGEDLLVPGGWYQHAVLYQIIKQSNGQYTFRAFNTGDGIDYQNHFSVGSNRLMLPFIEVVDVTQERITHPYFLRALHEIKREPGTAHIFYEAVVPLLQGRAGTREYGPEHLHYPQASGTCSYAVIIAFYTQAMGDNSAARRLGFEIQTKAIHDYFLANEEKFARRIISRNLAKKGLVAYVIAARRSYDLGDINDEELQYTAALAERLSKMRLGKVSIARKRSILQPPFQSLLRPI